MVKLVLDDRDKKSKFDVKNWEDSKGDLFSVIFSLVSILKPGLNLHNHVCTKKSHRRTKKHFNLFFFSFFILSRILVSKNKPSEKPDIQTATFTTAGGVFLRKLFLFSANKKIKSGEGDFFVSILETSVHQTFVPSKKKYNIHDFSTSTGWNVEMGDGKLVVTLRGGEIQPIT